MEINPLDFQRSITRELTETKNRVRNLIADANWGEEGRYKEAILKKIIKRFLPSNISIGTGFILKARGDLFGHIPWRDYKREIEISRQIDIILYDNTCPTLFSEGDFIITTAPNVKGIIEVKTDIHKLNQRKIQQLIDNSIINGKIINSNIFHGVFSFDYSGDINSNSIRELLTNMQGYVNHLSFGPNFL